MGIQGSEYQDQTAYDRHGMSGGGLDWGSQPSVFREYPQLPFHPLPESPPWPEGNIREVMCGPGMPLKEAELFEEDLAAILYLSGGLTARAKHGEGLVLLQSAGLCGSTLSVRSVLRDLRSPIAGRRAVPLRSGSIRAFPTSEGEYHGIPGPSCRSVRTLRQALRDLPAFSYIFSAAPGNTGNERTGIACLTQGTFSRTYCCR